MNHWLHHFSGICTLTQVIRNFQSMNSQTRLNSICPFLRSYNEPESQVKVGVNDLLLGSCKMEIVDVVCTNVVKWCAIRRIPAEFREEKQQKSSDCPIAILVLSTHIWWSIPSALKYGWSRTLMKVWPPKTHILKKSEPRSPYEKVGRVSGRWRLST